MTKIYVVKTGKTSEEKFIIDKVFTNCKKAEAYADWLNRQEWFTKEENFAWVRTYRICKLDYSLHEELPY